MKKNILLRTNVLVCLIIAAGFFLTAVLSYQANYSASLKNIEQVSDLTSEGIFYRISSTFAKPVNVSLTMANDSLLKTLLFQEDPETVDREYVEVVREYLDAYREKYGYDSVFLVSAATGRYYNFNGLDRVLLPGDPENVWYFDLLESSQDHGIQVDNDEVAGADNDITMFVNCKLFDEDGGILGIVGVGLRIDGLQALLQSYQADFGVNAYLVDKAGIVAISTELTGFDGVALTETAAFDETALKTILDWREPGAPRTFWAARQENYVVTRYLPELDWHLVVEQNTGALLASLNHQLAATLVIILLIIAFILYVITQVIRSFNQRIIHLTRSMEEERRTLFEQATQDLFENIHELDITHNRSANQATDRYFESLGISPDTPFDQVLRIIAETQVKEEFRQGYLDTFAPKNVQRAFDAGQDSLSYEFLSADSSGSYYWVRILARLITLVSDGSTHMLVYRQNIDAEKRQEHRMQALAQTDEMTGLLTKTATRRRIQQQLEAAPEQPYAFFILDIDHFKRANDQWGHAFGDTVIVSCAETIRACFRKDDIIGRIGGDEFVIFLPVPDRNWAEDRAQLLSDALNRIHTADGKRWKVSVSIGLSLAPEHGGSFETLYRYADDALYQSKAEGRSRWTVYGETAH